MKGLLNLTTKRKLIVRGWKPAFFSTSQKGAQNLLGKRGLLPVAKSVLSNEKIIFLSSSGGADREGISKKKGTLVSDLVEEQASQAFKNIGALLEDAGSSFGNIVKATIFLTNMSDLSKVQAELEKCAPKQGVPTSWVGMASLPRNGTCLMIENLVGKNLINNKGEKVAPNFESCALSALYFSASWCLPCHYFTKQLAKFYEIVNKEEKKFEVVWVSGDDDEGEYKAYFQKMPWVGIPFSDSGRIQSLSSFFRVRGIPSLFVLDNRGTIISPYGKDDVLDKGQAAYNYWISIQKSKHGE